MPATSQQQQKLMGIVHALQKGDIKPSKVSKKAQQMAKSMKPGDVKDFAGTKHKGLPKKAKKENMNMYVVRKPTADMQEADLVLELNPLDGIQPLNIMQHDVMSVHHDETEARRIAAEAYKKCMDEAFQLEEKKGKVGDKLKKAIDQLEKKRKEHIDMAKEDPKNASQHKEHIAKLATQIDDLMSKMEKIEKSKKNVEKKEDKKEEDKKKDLKEEVEVQKGAGKVVTYKGDGGQSILAVRFPINQIPSNFSGRIQDVLDFLKAIPGSKPGGDGDDVGYVDFSFPYTTTLSDEDLKAQIENSKSLQIAAK